MRIKAALKTGLKSVIKYKWHIIALALVALGVWMMFFRCTETFKSAGVATNAAPVPTPVPAKGGADIMSDPKGWEAERAEVAAIINKQCPEHGGIGKVFVGACNDMKTTKTKAGLQVCYKCYSKEEKEKSHAESAALASNSFNTAKKAAPFDLQKWEAERAEINALTKKECPEHGGFGNVVTSGSCQYGMKPATTKAGQVCYKCWTKEELEKRAASRLEKSPCGRNYSKSRTRSTNGTCPIGSIARTRANNSVTYCYTCMTEAETAAKRKAAYVGPRV